MKLSRLAALIFGAALGLVLPAVGALPARAADAPTGLALTVDQPWAAEGTQGTWTPYSVTVRNDGPADFTGDVWLVPADPRHPVAAAYPAYRTRVAVARGGERSVAMYVIDAPGGYQAQVRDEGGRTLLREDLKSIVHATSSLAILSDLPQADQRILAPLRTLSRVDASLRRFPGAPAFPTSAVNLAGLGGLIVDQFDSAALSPAQVQALRDFVGLGGSLILAGGPSWRRTLLPLPADLLPLRPAATGAAGLRALSDLAGRDADPVAQVVTGEVKGRVVLAAAGGLPLVVEGAYGAGRVIELAFDPFGEPFDSQAALAATAWSQAIERAVSLYPAPGRGGFGGGPGNAGAGSGLVGAWAPGFSPGADQLFQLLQDTPAAATPPAGLLGGLLLAYVLLAGLLNYLFLKAAGRRGLMWVTTPLIAILFTGAAYGVGFGTRGSDFFDNEFQVQRLAPDGAVETYAFHGIFAPHKGDFRVRVPAATQVSTAVNQGTVSGGEQAVVTLDQRPEIRLTGVGVWSMRTVQTLAVGHPYSYLPRSAMPLEAHLQLVYGHFRGTISNRGSRIVTGLRLVGGAGTDLALAPAIPPGASVSVDVEATPAGPGGGRGGAGTRPTALRLAALEAVGGRPGALSLVGLTAAGGGLVVDGARPSHTVLAALVEPVELEMADSLTASPPPLRLVSSLLAESNLWVNVYDFDLKPGRGSRPPALGYTFVPSQSGLQQLEVFDWGAGTWRPLPRLAPQVNRQASSTLQPGEFGAGTIRVRVHENAFNSASLMVAEP